VFGLLFLGSRDRRERNNYDSLNISIRNGTDWDLNLINDANDDLFAGADPCSAAVGQPFCRSRIRGCLPCSRSGISGRFFIANSRTLYIPIQVSCDYVNYQLL
jgi:hypothetical protein